MLESKEAIANVIEVVNPDDFYKPAHTEIYDAILALYGRGESVDAITVAEELNRRNTLEQIGGKPYIHGLLEAYPTASSAGHYARIVEDHSLLRRLVDAGTKVQEIGFSIPEDIPEAIDTAEELIYDVGNRRLRDDIQPIRKLLTQNMESIEQLYERGESIIGLASGFPDLDEMTAGFQPSNLIIVAARPSQGKSALMADFALNAATRQSAPCVIFSLEMSRHEMVQRFLSSEGKVDSQRIRRGTLQEQDWTRLSSALGRLAEAPIFIDDSANVTLMEMRAKCRRLKAKYGLGLVIVDYLQLMQSPRRSENRQQEVSEISRGLKILAKELEVPVICASQLNRGVEYRSDKRPLLGDLRESGCLAGDTLVTLATGERRPIASLVGAQPEVVTLDGWHMSTVTATKVWRTGRKQVFRLTTATGRRVRATSNHPFLKFEGWQPLGELKPGDRIGIPRIYPQNLSTDPWPPEKLILRRMTRRRGTTSAGTPRSRHAPSRALRLDSPNRSAFGTMTPESSVLPQDTLAPIELLDDVELKEIASSEIFWDKVVSIEPDGVEDVFDMTVPGTHNFVGDGVLVHNSIEQDSDLVMFIYRDEVYNPDTEHRGEAELILAKHRNGPTGIVRLAFMNQYTKFASIAGKARR